MPTINSFLEVLHALPGAGEVDVYINEELLEENLAYKGMSLFSFVLQGNITANATQTQEIHNAKGITRWDSPIIDLLGSGQ
jgi:hypothetical protein